ncbi:MAG TPA: UDP-glucose/GDP-mannose dehydrogenase family protein [Bacillus bacterium]|nr:UDP-glucose/GDP-mannose dehydrogenase family protein [Bacillus sp. (in: firmicutes)]
MNIAVIGTGYVGLVTGVCLADIGHTVTCIDIDVQKVNKMQQGISPIYEPGLEELMKKNIEAKRLFFTTKHKDGITSAEAIYIAVGTPQAEDGSANLEYVIQASIDIAEHVTNDAVVITKSTVPVGTNRLIQQTIAQNVKHDIKLKVVSNPEFLREGHAIYDTFHGDRIVIGSDDPKTASFVEKIYKPFGIPLLKTAIESAELIKYASNAFLATKISFINEIANLCEKVGANVQDVAEGMGMDHRIGAAFLNAGIGYGGSCFPKDTLALLNIAGKNGYDFKILKEVIEVNKLQQHLFIQKVVARFDTLQGKIVAVLGLTFKPNTDDMREAPSLTIINELLSLGANVKAYDPVAVINAKGQLPDSVIFSNSIKEALIGVDTCLILTEWQEFQEIDLQQVKQWMRTPIIFDGRNCLQVEEIERSGIEYYQVGNVK